MTMPYKSRQERNEYERRRRARSLTPAPQRPNPPVSGLFAKLANQWWCPEHQCVHEGAISIYGDQDNPHRQQFVPVYIMLVERPS